MAFLDDIIKRAKEERKTIVLPEATDLRTLKAVDLISKEDFCNVVLIGNKEEVLKIAEEHSFDVSKAQIIEPSLSEDYKEFVEAFYELRKHKGMTMEKSEELMKEPVFFGMMMIKKEKADGLVSGAGKGNEICQCKIYQIMGEYILCRMPLNMVFENN